MTPVRAARPWLLGVALGGCAAPPPPAAVPPTAAAPPAAAAPRCAPGADATPEHLGVRPRPLLDCIRALLLAQRDALPDAALAGFVNADDDLSDLYRRYQIPRYLGVLMLLDAAGRVRAVDVIVFNRLRKRYGEEPLRRAQYAALAALLSRGAPPSPQRGRRLYDQIAALAAAAAVGEAVVTRHRGVTVESRFTASGVRHRFVPTQR